MLPDACDVETARTFSPNNSFTSPPGDFYATWEINGTEVTFFVTAQTTGWAGLGISNTPDMVAADIILVYVIDGVINYYDAYAVEHAQPPADTSLGGFNNIFNFTGNFTTTGGISNITFQYTRKLDTGDIYDTVLVSESQYILYATGQVIDGVLIQHVSHGVYGMNFFGGAASVAPATTLENAHGSLMMVAWILFFTTGALIGHKYREFTDRWFPVHIAFQVSGTVIIIIAIILIFVDRGVFILSAHSVIGLTVLSLVCVQIILGVTSNRIPATRTVAHFLHRWGGRTTIALAFTNMLLGYYMINGRIALYVILSVWFLLFLVAFFLPLRKKASPDGEGQPSPKYLTRPSKVFFLAYLSLALVMVAVLLALLLAPVTTST